MPSLLAARKLIQDGLVYLLVRTCLCVVQALSIEACERLAEAFAWLANDVLRLRRSVVDGNLTLVFPEWSAARRRETARAMWKHLALMVCEVAHAPRKIHETNWRRYISLPRRREMVEFFLDARPRVLVSGHFGNFELANQFCGLLGFPTHAIARDLDNHFLHRLIQQFRTRQGTNMLAKGGSAAEATAVLEARGILALLGDQHAGPKGCWVDFLGHPASCHKALALFTLTGGAPMMLAYARRDRQPMRFVVDFAGIADPARLPPELEGVKPLTQWYNDGLGAVIRQNPEQYWWVHRRWKGEPPRRRKAPRPAAAAIPESRAA